ncbi:hypothetical protein SELMODRAFT_422552 [Selaginella moellendorffii]|uniref:alanine--tRNA ligase n=1 Tax=Selaginella moellendorffii TaxID=88036 RepID=D8SIT1_SELML|nr:hypothetical protein SELMODRAFT_422552 [Selaginella moellendorffii]
MRNCFQGLEKFNRLTSDLKSDQLSGEDAFLLWDTYGFPIDLTQLMAEEKHIRVDIEGFNRVMEEAKEKARAARGKSWRQTKLLTCKLNKLCQLTIRGRKPIEPKHLQQIESIVEKQIKDALPVYTKEASLAQAKRIIGLRAVFGEVYPDPVRVVTVGKPVEDLLSDPENPEWAGLSTEFCGGPTLEKEVAALKSSLDAAELPAARKTALRLQLNKLQERIRKDQKAIADANLKLAIKAAVDTADALASKGEKEVTSKACLTR